MGHKHIRRLDFKQIKSLLADGITARDISQITNRGLATISRINQSSNFADYRRQQSSTDKRYSINIAPVEALKPKVTRAHISPQEYQVILSLNSAKLTPKQIVLVSNRNINTIHRILKSDNYEHYQAITKALSQPKPERPQEPTAPSASEPQAFPTEAAQLDSQMMAEVLMANTRALNDLARAWNTMSDKLDEVLETKRPWLSGKER